MYFKPFKSKRITLNISSTFLIRSRCKSCSTIPNIYWYVRNTTLVLDPRIVMDSFAFWSNFSKSFNSSYYLFDDPKNSTNISQFKYKLYKAYRPRLHRTIGANPQFDIVEFLMCSCGKSNWAFSEKAIVNREIIHHKARYIYPKKFT